MQRPPKYERLLQMIEEGSITTAEICQRKHPEISSATFHSTMNILFRHNLVHRISQGKKKIAYQKSREFSIEKGREAIRTHHEEIARKYRAETTKPKISTESDDDKKALDNLLDAFLNTVELLKGIEDKHRQATVILSDLSKQIRKFLNSRRG